jgi:hypothetical protein
MADLYYCLKHTYDTELQLYRYYYYSQRPEQTLKPYTVLAEKAIREIDEL